MGRVGCRVEALVDAGSVIQANGVGILGVSAVLGGELAEVP